MTWEQFFTQFSKELGIPGQCLFRLLILGSIIEQIAKPFKPCHRTTRTNILHCPNKMQLNFSQTSKMHTFSSDLFFFFTSSSCCLVIKEETRKRLRQHTISLPDLCWWGAYVILVQWTLQLLSPLGRRSRTNNLICGINAEKSWCSPRANELLEIRH